MLGRLKKFVLPFLSIFALTAFKLPVGAAEIIPPATGDTMDPGSYILICAVLLVIVAVLIIFSLKNRKK